MFEYLYLGILISIIVWPIVTYISELFFLWIEYLKTKISLKITKVNAEINKITEEEIPSNGFAIGFQAPDQKEEGFYEEE